MRFKQGAVKDNRGGVTYDAIRAFKLAMQEGVIL
jgi:hypothetical protein